MSAEGVGTDDDGSWSLVGLEESLSFARWEKAQKLVC